MQTIQFDGQVWYVLALGTKNDKGETFCHLKAANTANCNKKTGQPWQINAWVDNRILKRAGLI